MKISVIVPVYNTEKYLNKCIDSILNQTFKDFELILVDDGSTDSSGAICDEYSEKDNRVSVIHKENGGQATARNMGLDIAKGEYISFIDSDDYIEPEMYDKMLSAIESTGAEIAMCGRFLVSSDYSKKTNSFILDEQAVWENDEIKERFLLANNLGASPCDKLFKRDLFETPPQVRFPKGYICEDLMTIFDVVFRIKKFVHIGIGCYNYYQRENSTSRGNSLQEKTYGIIIYPKQMQEKVYEKYPQFSNEVDYYYARHLMFFMFYLDPRYNKAECKKSRKELLKYKRAFKKYAPRSYKRYFKLFECNIFYFLRRIKRFLKKR